MKKEKDVESAGKGIQMNVKMIDPCFGFFLAFCFYVIFSIGAIVMMAVGAACIDDPDKSWCPNRSSNIALVTLGTIFTFLVCCKGGYDVKNPN